MTTVLFVHGMGTFRPGWSKPAQDALDGAAQDHGYAFFQGALPSSRVAYKEWVYDDAFDDALKAWSDLANDPGSQALLKLQWMEDLHSSPNFLSTHVLDVAQWYFLTAKRNQIINARASEFLSLPDIADTHIVAHSLGTSVVQRTLQAVGSGIYGRWDSTLKKLRSLHMVANVSRVLEDTDTPVYGGSHPSLVRPKTSAQDMEHLCSTYYTYHHLLDPFMVVRPFSPCPWQVPDFYDGTVHTTQGLIKVHDLEHYLSAPEVHIPIFRCIFGHSAITRDEERTALPANAPQVPIPPALPHAGGIQELLNTIARNEHLLT